MNEWSGAGVEAGEGQTEGGVGWEVFTTRLWPISCPTTAIRARTPANTINNRLTMPLTSLYAASPMLGMVWEVTLGSHATPACWMAAAVLAPPPQPGGRGGTEVWVEEKRGEIGRVSGAPAAATPLQCHAQAWEGPAGCGWRPLRIGAWEEACETGGNGRVKWSPHAKVVFCNCHNK